MSLGELIAPCKRTAGIDNRPRVGKISRCPFFRRETRIDWTAPTIGCDLDTSLRIAASGHGPHDICHIRGIDIVIDEHDEPSEVSSLPGAQRYVGRLSGMTAVALFD